MPALPIPLNGSAPAPAPAPAPATPTATDPGHLLGATGLTAGYGDLAAIRDITFGVRAGEIVALFGPNGAGKTTTLLACVGLLPCIAGEVRWQGATVKHGSIHKLARTGLAYVPEGRSVTTSLSVRANLRLGRGTVDDAVAIFQELEPLLERPAGLLSGGEQQMLVVARALAGRPRCLLVDELSLGLAPLIVQRLLAALRESARRDGLAVVLVEQQAREALSVADRWYLLRDGRIAHTGDAGAGAGELEAAYLASLINAPNGGAAGPNKER